MSGGICFPSLPFSHQYIVLGLCKSLKQLGHDGSALDFIDTFAVSAVLEIWDVLREELGAVDSTLDLVLAASALPIGKKAEDEFECIKEIVDVRGQQLLQLMVDQWLRTSMSLLAGLISVSSLSTKGVVRRRRCFWS